MGPYPPWPSPWPELQWALANALACVRARVAVYSLLKFEVSLRAFATMRQLVRTRLGVRRDVSSLFISTHAVVAPAAGGEIGSLVVGHALLV